LLPAAGNTTPRETALIVRYLPTSGNAKLSIGKSRVSDLRYSTTARYAEITPVRVLLVTHYLVTEKARAKCEKVCVLSGFSDPGFKVSEVSKFQSKSRQVRSLQPPAMAKRPTPTLNLVFAFETLNLKL
jgi:hypothetical protein